MKLIDRLLAKAINNSTVVVDTAVNAYGSALQLVRLARAVANLARVVKGHSEALAELYKFNRQLVHGVVPLEPDDGTALLNEIQSADDKKRMN